jgi:hypothetical protein
MQRNWEIVRKILIKLEEQGDTKGYIDAESVPPFDAETVSYHMQILDQAGLIKATCVKGFSEGLSCVAFSMTWDGHEFLDKIRRDTMWNKVKGILREKGIDLSF